MKTALGAVISIFLLILTPISLHGTTESSDPNSYFYPADSKPFGKSYPEWAAIWWKFVLEKNYPPDKYPSEITRLKDPDGSLCAVNQTGNVWILPGAASGNHIRNCTIPKEVSLLISPTDGYCNTERTPESELENCAYEDIKEDVRSGATLDGIELAKNHEVNFLKASVPFDLYYPWGQGPYKTVAAGVYIMLKPLPPGNHTLYQFLQTGDTQDITYSVTYHLTIN